MLLLLAGDVQTKIKLILAVQEIAPPMGKTGWNQGEGGGRLLYYLQESSLHIPGRQ